MHGYILVRGVIVLKVDGTAGYRIGGGVMVEEDRTDMRRREGVISTCRWRLLFALPTGLTAGRVTLLPFVLGMCTTQGRMPSSEVVEGFRLYSMQPRGRDMGPFPGCLCVNSRHSGDDADGDDCCGGSMKIFTLEDGHDEALEKRY